ncbi:MAG: HPr family phosphocarrier protein [Caldilineaceae bacterium]
MAEGAGVPPAQGGATGAPAAHQAARGSRHRRRAPATRKAAAHQITVTVPNRLGLHARPAARLVETAARFDAWVRYTCNGRHAAGDSINQIATLGARQGDQLTVATGGPEAEAVLRAVEALAAANFGDTDDAPPAPVAGATAVDAPPGAVTGRPVVPGIALGPALALDRTLPAVETRSIDDPPAEQARLDRAMAGVGAELEAVVVRTPGQDGRRRRGHHWRATAHLLDPALAAAALRIAAEQICAEAAWAAAIQGDRRPMPGAGRPVHAPARPTWTSAGVARPNSRRTPDGDARRAGRRRRPRGGAVGRGPV